MSYNVNIAKTKAQLDWDLGGERVPELERLENGWIQSFNGVSRFSLRESVLTYLRGRQIEFTVYTEKSVILLMDVKGKAYCLYPGLAELIALEGKEAGHIVGTKKILKFLREA